VKGGTVKEIELEEFVNEGTVVLEIPDETGGEVGVVVVLRLLVGVMLGVMITMAVPVPLIMLVTVLRSSVELVVMLVV
jgi:hypothetical protein